MTVTERKFMAVTMKPEMHARVKAIAAAREMPITAWIREVIRTEINRIEEEGA